MYYTSSYTAQTEFPSFLSLRLSRCVSLSVSLSISFAIFLFRIFCSTQRIIWDSHSVDNLLFGFISIFFLFFATIQRWQRVRRRNTEHTEGMRYRYRVGYANGNIISSATRIFIFHSPHGASVCRRAVNRVCIVSVGIRHTDTHGFRYVVHVQCSRFAA